MTKNNLWEFLLCYYVHITAEDDIISVETRRTVINWT
jgi:hypothetical protein